LATLLVAGVVAGGLRGKAERRSFAWLMLPLGIALALLAMPLLPKSGGVSAGSVPFGLAPLFLFFLKVGSILYGSGYVLLAFLRSDLVTRFGWLTSAQLLDAVAVGQVTPGPVFTTATFVGYLLGGGWGAAAATLGIFLPSFVFVAASGPVLPRIRKSPVAGGFLDGVNAAALALMAVVTWDLARTAIIDGPTAALAILSGYILIRYKPNSVWLLFAGAAVGTLFRLLGGG
jgi:chromate transporter